MKKTLPNLIKALEKHQSAGKSLKAIVGFDAYIDTVQKIIKTKEQNQAIYFETISEVATQLSTLSGKNTKVQLRPLEVRMSGNAPILANSLGALSIKNVCIATMGYPVVNSVFEEIHPNCELISIASPAKINILEFNDGKLIFTEESTFEQLTWSYVAALTGLDNLSRWVYESSLLAFVNWANIKHATDIWKGILENIVVNLAPIEANSSTKYFSRNKFQQPDDDVFGMRHKNFFFDLANISKRNKEEIIEVLELISKYAQYGRVSLSMNEEEARYIFALNNDYEEPNLILVAQNLLSKYHIKQIFVHTNQDALLVQKNHHYEVKGKQTIHKRVSTGERDNFNAGVCFGLILDLLPEQTLALAMANYEAYASNGASLELDELINYLKGLVKEFHHEVVSE